MRYRENDKWIDLSQEEIDSRNNEKSSGAKKKKSSSHATNACEVHQYSNRSSKKDLEEYGRTIGIELDRRKTNWNKFQKDFLAGN